MIEIFLKAVTALMNVLPPIGRQKSPTAASAIGLAFGGLGLAIYFRSFVDLVVPIALAFATGFVVKVELHTDLGSGWLGAACVAAAYGYFRASSSNARIAPADGTLAIPAGQS